MNARYWEKRFDGARRVTSLHRDLPNTVPLLPMSSPLMPLVPLVPPMQLGGIPATQSTLPGSPDAPAQLR